MSRISSKHIPRVSIGLPVYNGENFLEEAIDSILTQSFTDFELIISDNASTDRTESICHTYAAKDHRIRYVRNTENHGAAWNYNRVVELSSGEYFKWMAHDDVCAPDFLMKCIKVLDEDSSVVLCHPKAIDIDEHSNSLRNHNYELDTQSRRPYLRFRDLICVNHSCLQIFGVIRMNVLKETPLIDNYIASDRSLLAEIGLRGRFYETPEFLLLHREHPLRSTRILPTLHSRKEWFDPKKKKRLVFPTWRLLKEYLLCIRRPPLSRRQRLMCYVQMLLWLRLNWKTMFEDVIWAAKQISKRGKNGKEYMSFL